MAEEITDDREYDVMAIPFMKVVRVLPNPEGERFYVVMQKTVDKNGDYAGWKIVSKGYKHSTSAFAALGRLAQKSREKAYSYKPENER